MSTPQLYLQLQTQLSQWITPKDKRHLTVFAENIAAILQAQSGCLSHWLTYLSHRSALVPPNGMSESFTIRRYSNQLVS